MKRDSAATAAIKTKAHLLIIEARFYGELCDELARGIMDLTMRGLAIGNGILTCENEAQAWARARVAEMDKGGGAADAALAMVRFTRDIKKRRTRT